jgi:hypothetical protein
VSDAAQLDARAIAQAMGAAVGAFGALGRLLFERDSLGRRAAMVGGVGALSLAWWLAGLGAWDVDARREAYAHSATAGAWLDRELHFGAASACFLAAGCLWAMRPARDERALPARALAAASLASLALTGLAVWRAIY